MRYVLLLLLLQENLHFYGLMIGYAGKATRERLRGKIFINLPEASARLFLSSTLNILLYPVFRSKTLLTL